MMLLKMTAALVQVVWITNAIICKKSSVPKALGLAGLVFGHTRRSFKVPLIIASQLSWL